MAGLDTSIALGIKPVDFGDPNEGRMNALRAQMMQMQMQQGQFNMMKAQRDMEYQNQQRARAAAEAAKQKAKEEAARREFMAAYGATGNVNVPIPAQVAEPGAASDVGMLGSQNAMPEYQPSSMMMTQPKDLRAATNALIQGGKFDAANLGMGYGNAVTEAEKKDVELRKAKTEASSSEAKAIDENLKPFRAYAAAVNSPEAAAAYVSAMFDHPVLGTMAQKVSGQTKEQAIASAMKDYAADPQRWMAAHVGLTGEQVMKVLSGESKDGKKSSLAIAQSERQALVNQLAKDPTNQAIQNQIAQYDSLISKETKVPGTSTKTQQLQEYRDQLKTQLDKDPANEMLQQKYDEANAAVMRETRYGDKGLPPLDKGYTYNKEGDAVLIPGSKADRDERLKAVGDRKKVVGNTGQLDEAVKNIDELLDPENAKAFNDNFGGYVQKTTADKLTGKTATTYNMIQQLKANTAKLGLDDFRVNGSIGAMTEREWPIVQAAIASLDPKMPAVDAARKIKDIRDKMTRMKDDAVDTYNLQWGGTKYHTPVKGGTGVQFGGAAPATAPAQGEVVQWGDLK